MPVIALLCYHASLLLRSHRWLPPALVYAAFLGIGVQTGGPILDSYGYASAALLPVAVWMVRVCTMSEPPAARNCVAAAAGPGRAHLACVLTGGLASAVFALAGTAFVALVSDPYSSGHRKAVPILPATGAGLLTGLACVLLGVGIGALCNWPLLRSPGWAIPAGAAGALLVLVVGASPANAAVSGLVAGSASGTATVPWLPLAGAALAAVVATAVACALSSRRG